VAITVNAPRARAASCDQRSAVRSAMVFGVIDGHAVIYAPRTGVVIDATVLF